MAKYTDAEIYDQAKEVVAKVMGDLKCEQFTIDDVARGMKVEYEHGTENPLTDVTGDDPLMTGKIALAHILEMRDGKRQVDYYDGLAIMETSPTGYWRGIRPDSYWMHKRVGFVLVVIILLISLYKIIMGWKDGISLEINGYTIVFGLAVYLAASWK